jgi:hypothetical protein
MGVDNEGILRLRPERGYVDEERIDLLELKQKEIGGREGDRTLGPRIANAVLSQLSYSPTLVWVLNVIYQAK